jgi:polyphosphate kinase 2
MYGPEPWQESACARVTPQRLAIATSTSIPAHGNVQTPQCHLNERDRSEYEASLRQLQIELVKVQRHIIKHGHKILVIFEGRDASGKNGTIKRIVEHLSPRETRVVALGVPSDRERASWYFQRYASHLPAAHEMVLFNRSWYNRAGVEHVMGFCTAREYESFLEDVLPFEQMLVGAGIQILKYYLDISKKEQAKRLHDRRRDPLKQWKMSSIDKAAVKRFDAYTKARDRMLTRTSSPLSPWVIARADDKHAAHLNIIRDLLSRVACPDRDKHLAIPDRNVVFPYDEAHLKVGLLAA